MGNAYWDRSYQCLGGEHEKCKWPECQCACHSKLHSGGKPWGRVDDAALRRADLRQGE